MSTPTTLDSIFKGATTVTSLESDDRLLAVDSVGKPKKISSDNFAGLKSVTLDASSSPWIRALRWSNANPASCILHLTYSFWSGSPGGIILAIGSVYNNNPSVVSLVNGSYVQEARLVKRDGTYFLDFKIYCRRADVKASGHYVTPLCELNPEILSSAVVNAVQVATFGGGGKSLCFNALHFNRASGERRAA